MEQDEYTKEAINWSYVAFVDNQDVLDLIEKVAFFVPCTMPLGCASLIRTSWTRTMPEVRCHLLESALSPGAQLGPNCGHPRMVGWSLLWRYPLRKERPKFQGMASKPQFTFTEQLALIHLQCFKCLKQIPHERSVTNYVA
jgi:hypothetical protein